MRDRPFFRIGWQRLALWWVLVLLVFPAERVCAAAPDQVVFVISENSPVYLEVVEAAKAGLTSWPHVPGVSVIAAQSVEAQGGVTRADLVVTVGLRAAQSVSSGRQPVLHVMVPRAAHEAGGGKLHGATVFIDQPPERLMRLARELLGRSRPVLGVLLGPDTGSWQKPLQQLALEQGVRLHVHALGGDDLQQALRGMLPEVDALLALPDAAVYNARTLQTILLSSYRQQKPVIAFSAAYVRAGALAAVHSTPQQIGQHTAELLRRYGQGSGLPAGGQYPRHFSVAVNTQVARSFGLLLDSETALADRLRSREH